MIKAVIFDFGNVTVKFDETPHFSKWASCGNRSFSDVRSYYDRSPTRKAFERGEVTPRQFYEKYVHDLGLRIDFNDFVQNYCNIFSRNREIEEIIMALKGKYKLILLSNINELQYEFAEKRYPILGEFDEYVLSYKVGIRKPNPFIFLKAVRKSGVLPFNCVYFDDIPEFVYIARLIGIRAFQYKDAEKLRRDLKKVL